MNLMLTNSLTQTDSHKRSAVSWLLYLTVELRLFLLLPGLCERHAASSQREYGTIVQAAGRGRYLHDKGNLFLLLYKGTR